MRVYKSDGSYVDDTKDTEFGWYFSEIAVDENDDKLQEYNEETRVLSKLRKSLTKEYLFDSIDIPDLTELASEALVEDQIPIIKTEPILKTETPIFDNAIRNANCSLPPKEKLADIISPCNPETKMLLSVIYHAKYKHLMKEEITGELLKTVNLKTTNFKCLINDRKTSLTEDIYKEIVNYHATKEDNMMSLMMELILTDVDCNLDDIIDVPEPEMKECTTELPNFIIETSDLGNSIHSSNSSKGEHRHDSDYLQVSSRSNILSSLGLSEEDRSIQNFCSETYEMHLELSEIRRSFQESETKVKELLKEAISLKNDLRETQYLDDILHLMKGDLDKVKLKKLPFKLFHQSGLQDPELNFII